jgi:hypothetical protein
MVELLILVPIALLVGCICIGWLIGFRRGVRFALEEFTRVFTLDLERDAKPLCASALGVERRL